MAHGGTCPQFMPSEIDLIILRKIRKQEFGRLHRTTYTSLDIWGFQPRLQSAPVEYSIFVN
jgi:hypothetical protein